MQRINVFLNVKTYINKRMLELGQNDYIKYRYKLHIIASYNERVIAR